MIEIFYFIVWTFLLYIIHIAIHHVPYLKSIHWNHHRYIVTESIKSSWTNNPTNWHWNNIFLFNDTWISTLDLWITEVVPTFLFALITGQWWIFYFYYIWAAFVQESIEHNPKINFYPFTSGQWHLVHHQYFNKNYGLFHPFWDRLFRTEMLQ